MSEIRCNLFPLAKLPNSPAPNFGHALMVSSTFTCVSLFFSVS